MTGIGIGVILIMGIMGGEEEITINANSCVECHKKTETITALPDWAREQFIHWYGSVHGKKGVTCEKCHGGKPTLTDKKLSHTDVKQSNNPESSIYYKNLPETCGSCHSGVYQQFIQSHHYKNLKIDQLAPTCTTCHGFQMDIRGVTPLQIVGRCILCHNPEKRIKPEVIDLMLQIIEGINQTENAIQKSQMAVELAREQGIEAEDAKKLLKTALNRLKKTSDLWHKFQLNVFRQEIVEVRALADNAYTSVMHRIHKK